MRDGSAGRVGGGIGAQTLLIHVFVEHLHGRGIVTLTQPHLPQSKRHRVTLVSGDDRCLANVFSEESATEHTVYTLHIHTTVHAHHRALDRL